MRNIAPLVLGTVLATSAAHAQDNTATGYQALNSNTTGTFNTATGAKALRDNTTGSNNTATGRGALYKNTAGQNNTATGVSALYMNSGHDNTAHGFEALVSNTNGYSNAALGFRALYSNTTGSGNVAVGNEALKGNTTAEANVAIGLYALSFGTTGNYNVAVGAYSLMNNTTGQSNTGVGFAALNSNATGSYNTALGQYAGPGSGASNLSNTSALGYQAAPTASNTIRIGNDSITSIGGIVGWSNLSDARFKTNVTANVPGIEFIKRLRPVTFNWDLAKLDAFHGREVLSSDKATGGAREEKARKVFTGFLAQEVEDAAMECGFDFSGIVKPANDESTYNLSYAEFVVPLVRAVQEQQQEIDELKKLVHVLSSNQGKMNPRVGHASTLGDSFGFVLATLGGLSLLVFVKRKMFGARPA
jgi:hypothetical protein